MNLTEFQLSQDQSSPPAGLSLALQSLWFDAKGDWNKAHELALVGCPVSFPVQARRDIHFLKFFKVRDAP